MAGPDVLQCVLRPESVEAHYERVQVYVLIYGLLDMGVTEVLSLCAKKYRSQRHFGS